MATLKELLAGTFVKAAGSPPEQMVWLAAMLPGFAGLINISISLLIAEHTTALKVE